jgi:hypothetical protein
MSASAARNELDFCYLCNSFAQNKTINMKDNLDKEELMEATREARLLFRMTDGQPFKRYTDDIPLWAQTIISR